MIFQLKSLKLIDTILTNCTYSSNATSYGNDGSCSFQTTRTGFEGELRIAGTTVTAQNMKKDAIVKGTGSILREKLFHSTDY